MCRHPNETGVGRITKELTVFGVTTIPSKEGVKMLEGGSDLNSIWQFSISTCMNYQLMNEGSLDFLIISYLACMFIQVLSPVLP